MKTIRCIAAMLLACTATAAVQAQAAYPVRPITLVVPYPAGGAADTIARPLAMELGNRLGQPVVIDNRAGANGNIGSLFAARQPADGYTLLLGSTSTLAVNPHVYPSIGYDPIKDLQPITLTHQMPNVLVVGAKGPLQNVADVIAAAKADPGGLVYGSAGNGNSMHLAGLTFQEKTGTSLMHVPYRGGPPALNDVLAGTIPMMFHNLPAVVSHLQAGSVRVLAVADTKRSPVMPDVPTMDEAGAPGVYSGVWNGLLVPVGTPPEVVDRLNKELRSILESDAFKAPFEKMGYEVISSTPQELEALLAKDSAAMAVTMKNAQIQLD
ncbi:Bug family tripartite tricarboxylate transporter substrate binding protein [Lampropedia aestuarii]|uniref:Bug family tripartite tricarboxylate transporter substrate binding protein n=1 Tax=Lampropedia aestuarii TaxID=2562762 RepID=UPI00246984AF|nr:tripartite tricarboxylate transporter substrate binding protein [Lampropedia aestuarii]MDH5858703.1 tripartite tricarboxylate transporter substrate binding protein [Lampropedia aestuarii]